MGVANPNREKALAFIAENKNKMNNVELIKIAANKFNYSLATIKTWVYSPKFAPRRINDNSLRAILNKREEIEQKMYERKMAEKIKNRPKIRIEMG